VHRITELVRSLTRRWIDAGWPPSNWRELGPAVRSDRRAVVHAYTSLAGDQRTLLHVFGCLLLVGLVLGAYWSGSDAHVVKFAMPSVIWPTQNPAPGYNMIWHGELMNLENIYFFTQTEALQGVQLHHTALFTDRRIFYAFLALPFRPFLNDFAMFQMVNAILFAASGTVLFAFVMRLFESRLSAIFAVFLFVFSLPAAVTIGSFSSHIASMFFTFLWAFLMLRYVTGQRDLSLLEAIGYSSVLGMWALSYGSWIAGLGIFVCLLTLRRQFLLIPIPAIVGFGVGMGQMSVMELAGYGTSSDMVQSNIVTSLQYHYDKLMVLDPAYFEAIRAFAVDTMLVDNPLIIALGLVSLLIVRLPVHVKLFLLFFVVSIPAVLFVYQPAGFIRGYAIPGVVIIPLAIAGHVLARLAVHARNGGPALMSVSVGVIGLVLVSQVAWSNAARFSVLLPTVSYYSGINNTCQPTTFASTQYLNMVGDSRDLPTVFGGTRPLSDALPVAPDTGRVPAAVELTSLTEWVRSWFDLKPRAFLVQSIILVLIVGVAIGLFPYMRNRKRAAVAVLIAFVILFVPMRHRALDFQSRVSIWGGERLTQTDQLQGRVQLSDQFLTELAAAAPEYPRLHLSFNHTGRGANCMTLEALGQRVPTPAPWSWGDPHTSTVVELPTLTAVDLLRQSDGVLTIAAAMDREGCEGEIVGFGGWQKADLSGGRQAWIVDDAGERRQLQRFPNIEFRLVRDSRVPSPGDGPFAELAEGLSCYGVIGL